MPDDECDWDADPDLASIVILTKKMQHWSRAAQAEHAKTCSCARPFEHLFELYPPPEF